MPIYVIVLIVISTIMHTSWNLMARDQRGSDILLRALMVIGFVGLGPVLLVEFAGDPILPHVWGYLLVAGVFQGLYFIGLTRGYRTGDFSMVYPLARGLPAVLVAFADLAQGNAPNAVGWLGIAFVAVGCTVLPLNSLKEFKVAHYWNQALFWTLLTAVATAGYSITDSVAAKAMPSGLFTALRYGMFELFLSWAFYRLFLGVLRLPASNNQSLPWRRVAGVGLLLFSAYSLVLWAYQLSDHTSYVVALRQFSIVLGVVVGSLYFREPARRLRLGAALIIVLGGICIALA